jgi:metal-responsive CopG/Arc/MetJ family transcriptional regulator
MTTRVDAGVELDVDVLDQVDRVAQQTGKSRAEVIEDSVRGALARRTLGGVFAKAKAGGLSPADAEDLAYQELRALRADQPQTP